MTTVRITGAQMHVSDNLSENLERMLRLLETSETDFMLFPEMSLTGYHGQFGQKAAERAWDGIAAICRQTYTTAIIGTGCTADGVTYIQSRIISDQGELIGTHEKLVPTLEDRTWCRPGEELRIFEHRGLRFGCLIGNDLWVAPGCGPYADRRLSYQLGEKGARAIFHSINSGTDTDYRAYYHSNLSLRAKEIGGFIFTANAAPDGGQLNVPSGVLLPDGQWVQKCPLQGEHTYTFDLDVE